MKKIFFIILLSLISVAFFAALLYYGFKHARGMPVPVEEYKRITLKAPFIDKEIDLTKGVSTDLWNSLPAQEIKLLYQVMVLPWPKAVTPDVTIKAFHNKKDIYFYIAWKDDTENRTVEINKFPDACAVMFPLDKETKIPTLMMGFLGKANIWHWKASLDKEYWGKEKEIQIQYADYYYPFEEKETLTLAKENIKSAVNDLMAIRVGTITSKEEQNVTGRGFWKEGVWEVVFKRSLKPIDFENDVNLFSERSSEKRLCAFAVWNGENGDRGGRKSISDWVELNIK